MATIIKKVKNKDNLLQEAYNVLLDRLGAEKTTRVWQLLVSSSGNYLKERKDLFVGKDIDAIYREAQKFNRK